jgi:hypothetical protein
MHEDERRRQGNTGSIRNQLQLFHGVRGGCNTGGMGRNHRGSAR